MATKTILELKVGDVIDHRGERAEVVEVWHDSAAADQGVREPHGCVIAWSAIQPTTIGEWDQDVNDWVDTHVDVVTEHRTRLVWPDVPANKRWMKHEFYDNENQVLVKPAPGCVDVCCDADAFAAELDRQIAERTLTLVD